jgi:hypothetical protein
LKEKKR